RGGATAGEGPAGGWSGVAVGCPQCPVPVPNAATAAPPGPFRQKGVLAGFGPATGAQSTYTESFDNLTPRATRSKTYDTSSGMDAVGEHKKSSAPGVLPNRRATPTSK